MDEPCVVSVGGSLIYPSGGIDIDFLKKFNTFVRSHLSSHPKSKLYLVTGGGRVARMYQEVAKILVDDNISAEQLDEIGIRATRQNAYLLHVVLSDVAYHEVITDYDNLPKVKERILIGAGWKPGHSTDFDAVRFAEYYKAPVIVNLSNIDQVYDKDPNVHDDAQPIASMKWDELLTLTGSTWDPGANVPFDPIAAKKARELKKKVVILNGNDFENLEKYCKGDTFIGTIIE